MYDLITLSAVNTSCRGRMQPSSFQDPLRITLLVFMVSKFCNGHIPLLNQVYVLFCQTSKTDDDCDGLCQWLWFTVTWNNKRKVSFNLGRIYKGFEGERNFEEQYLSMNHAHRSSGLCEKEKLVLDRIWLGLVGVLIYFYCFRFL